MTERTNYNNDTNLNPELKDFLSDNKLDLDETKALTKIFEANKLKVLNISVKNLALLRKTILSNKTVSYITGTEKNIVKNIGKAKEKKFDFINGGYLYKESKLEEYSEPEKLEKPLKEEKEVNEKESNFSKQDIIKQAKNLLKRDIIKLQIMLGFTFEKGADGVFGPKTFARYSRLNENWKNQSLADYLSENIDNSLGTIEGDDKLSGKKIEFTEKYGDLLLKLEKKLSIPNGILTAIIYKESHFGKYLNSNTGSKGIIQLTKWPFREMMGDDIRSGTRSYKKVEKYRRLFSKIDLESIQNNPNIKINNEMLEQIRKIQDIKNTDNQDAAKIIEEFYILLKSDKNYYNHGLNIIFGSVYFTKLYNSNKCQNKDKNLINALEKYNNDSSIIKSKGITHKEYYAYKVLEYFKNKYL